MKFKKITPLSKEYLENLGFSWHTDSDFSPYLGDRFVEITKDEADAFYEAPNELYDMFVAAAQHVIDNNLFHELGIPFNLIDAITMSWENDVHWHLYGRFDLAGGIDGKPIKLIEFTADTPTALFETAIVQWAMLKQNEMNENLQFNDVYNAICENFKRLITLDESTEEFDKLYEGWKILFTCIGGNIEDEMTTKLLQICAQDAGFKTNFAYIKDIEFDDEEGVVFDGEKYEYLFKLIPWEQIAVEEGELALILENIMKNQEAIILNPAYTLLFQSKGIMKILWDLYPNHPLLLRSSFEPLTNLKQVKKPFLAREGANVEIIDANGKILASQDGEYTNQKFLYQEYFDFSTDENGQKYQPGVFFSYEACGLGFRYGGEIINNFSKFAGHFIKD